MVRTAASVLCIATACTVSPLHAQSDDRGSPAGEGLRVFSNFNFHMSMARFVTDDEQFVWDTDVGGDIDVIDYGVGRLNVLADFETILGEEFRAFDPNQGNYTLEGSATYRFGRSEIAGSFHHVSRHLSDRPKDFPIDWNMVGVQFWHRTEAGRGRIELGAHGFDTIQRSFVDYTFEVGGHAKLRYPVGARTAALLGAEVIHRGVERDVFGRTGRTGGLLEGGVRFEADDMAVEVFIAVERRIDADPILRRTRRWALVGFRLLNNR